MINKYSGLWIEKLKLPIGLQIKWLRRNDDAIKNQCRYLKKKVHLNVSVYGLSNIYSFYQAYSHSVINYSKKYNRVYKLASQ